MHTKLLKSQKNDVYSAIKDGGLDPNEFEWTEDVTSWIGRELVAKLIHKPTGFYFKFDKTGDLAHPRYYPDSSIAKVVICSQLSSWSKVLDEVKKWLSIVRREYLLPDLWEISQSEKLLVAKEIDDLDNALFTVEEQQRISGAINEIREFLLVGHIQTEEQQQFIEARLKHLEEASTRLGRKDWITLAMGTITNIVVGAALAPDAARELLRTTGELLGWVVGSVHLIP